MQTDRRSQYLGIIQLIFVVMVVSGALFITRLMTPKQSFDDAKNVSFTENAITVSVTRPQGITFKPRLTLTGTVTAQTETQIAPQVSGRVIWVNPDFAPGANVDKGDLLFRIESEDYRLAVEQAASNIAAAASELKVLEAEAKLALSEWRELYPETPISDLAARKPQMEAASARLAAAEASKKTAELALRRTRVTAPVDARILSTSLDVGQLVSPSIPVGALYAIGNVEIAVPVSAEELQLLSPVKGRKASLTLEGPAAHIEGEVTRLGSVLDPRTRQAILYIKPNDISGLTIGSFVKASIAASDVDGALTIPLTALAGRDQVWVVKGDELQNRRISVLDQSGDQVTVAPFDIGDGVLSFPPSDAVYGQKANIRSEGG